MENRIISSKIKLLESIIKDIASVHDLETVEYIYGLDKNKNAYKVRFDFTMKEE